MQSESRDYYQNRKYAGRRELSDKKREFLRRQKIKKHKRRMRRLFVLELLCIVGMFSFLLGKHVNAGDRNRITVENGEASLPVYGESGNSLADYGTEEPESAKLTEGREDILLVNKDYKLPEDYSVTLKKLPDGTNRAAEEAYQPLCDMLAAGRREGLSFEICSSYRDVKRQQELFDEDLNALMRQGYSYQEAYDEVAKETMPPGHSEHSTGLAFDIVSMGYQMLDAGQKKTAENKWLREHCAEYGFILRYPEGKEDITQISYESWHFRYVGVEAAKYIMENDLTLEEYLEI